MARHITIFFLALLPFLSYGQEIKLTEIIEDLAEELADTEEEAVNVYIERLYELSENPVKVNSASANEISKLFFLSDFQVKALMDYTRTSGTIFSVYEIANIPGFDKETATMMLPFISLDNNLKKNIVSDKWKNRSLINLSVKPGNNDTTNSGSPWKILTKYKFTAGSFSGGFTTEKDKGEKILKGNPSLPDFLSANLSWTGSGIIKKIIIGDFSARFGLGTTINTGLRTGLSLTAAGYMSGGDEIKPYTSTEENNFFRGTAMQFHMKKMDLSFFYSVNKIDATLNSTNGTSDSYIESFYRTGLHNTASSLIKKDAVTETNYGINLSYNLQNLRFGFLLTANKFSLPVLMTTQKPENIFDFEGEKNSNASAYYKGSTGRMILYGEVSKCLSGKIAFAQGISFRPADRLTLNILFRKYDPGFTAFHGKGPFSSSAGDNIKGIFGNFSFEAARHLFISAGCDLRYYTWLRYRCSAPSMAKSKELKISYSPSDELTFEASFNYRSSAYDVQESTGIKKQNENISRTFKWIMRYSPIKSVTFSTRTDYKISYPSDSKGTLLFQDVNYRFNKIPVSVWFRYCLFNTGSWDSRIFTYENDLLYSFSIPALSGKGSRSYLLINWEISKSAEIRIKYSVSELSDGHKTISNIDELKMQLKLIF